MSTLLKETAKATPPWLCVIVNLLAFPGMGTIMARRRFGYAQAALSLLGFAVFMGFMFWFFGRFLEAAGDITADLEGLQQQLWARSWIAGTGIALLVLSWVWALFSSITILRTAQAGRAPPPLPPPV